MWRGCIKSRKKALVIAGLTRNLTKKAIDY